MLELEVYELVDDEVARTHKKLSTKWHTVRKSEGTVRSRFVAREFRSLEVKMDLFAASGTAVTAKLIVTIAAKKQWWTMTGDISNAFLHAPEEVDVVCTPPPEWYLTDEGKKSEEPHLVEILS